MSMNTKRPVILALIVIMAMICHSVTTFGTPARETYPIPLYNEWAYLPADSLMAMGKRYVQIPDMRDSALVCYTIVANRYFERRQTKDELKQSVTAMYNVGTLYASEYFDYQKAYTSMMDVLEISKKEKLDDELPYIYLALGNILYTSDNAHSSTYYYDKVMSLYDEAFNAAMNIEDYRIMLVIVNNAIEISFLYNDTDNVSLMASKFLQLDIPSQPMLEFVRHLCEAMLAYKKGCPEEAIGIFSVMEKCIDDEFKPERYRLGVYIMRQFIYARMGQMEYALDNLYSAETLAKQTGVKDLLLEVYSYAGDCYREAGDSALAKRYRFAYLELKDSLLHFNKLNNVKEMQFMQSLDEINTQVRELSKKRREQSVVLLCVVCLAALLAIVVAVIIYNNRMLQKKNRLLYLRTKEMLRREENERRLRKELENELAAQSVTTTSSGDDMSESNNLNKKRKAVSNSLSETEKQEIYLRIMKVMADTEAICQEDFSLDRLAEMAKTKYKYASQIINEIYGASFYNMLKEYRINEACRRLSDIETYGGYTIEAIASGLGFRSRGNFVSAFKGKTGLTPSNYMKMVRSETYATNR